MLSKPSQSKRISQIAARAASEHDDWASPRRFYRLSDSAILLLKKIRIHLFVTRYFPLLSGCNALKLQRFDDLLAKAFGV